MVAKKINIKNKPSILHQNNKEDGSKALVRPSDIMGSEMSLKGKYLSKTALRREPQGILLLQGHLEMIP